MFTKWINFQKLPEIKLCIFKGSVLQTETWTSTHVSSSGGGGHLHNGTGYVAAPVVHSSTSTHQAIWIKDEDNQKDLKLNIPNNVNVMQGHKIKYVELFYKDRYIDYIYIENFNTEKYWMYHKDILAFATEITKTSSHFFIKLIFYVFLALLAYGLVASYINDESDSKYPDKHLYQMGENSPVMWSSVKKDCKVNNYVGRDDCLKKIQSKYEEVTDDYLDFNSSYAILIVNNRKDLSKKLKDEEMPTDYANAYKLIKDKNLLKQYKNEQTSNAYAKKKLVDSYDYLYIVPILIGLLSLISLILSSSKNATANKLNAEKLKSEIERIITQN